MAVGGAPTVTGKQVQYSLSQNQYLCSISHGSHTWFLRKTIDFFRHRIELSNSWLFVDRYDVFVRTDGPRPEGLLWGICPYGARPIYVSGTSSFTDSIT